MTSMRLSTLAPLALLIVTLSSPAAAGGFLDAFDITGRVPSPAGGDEVVARVIPARWDDRCIPVPLRLNDTLDPVPNPLGPDLLTLSRAGQTLDDAAGTWNQLPTSYVEAIRAGTISNSGLRAFDTVHEVTFRSAGSLFGFGRSFLTTLMEDTQLVPGDDIDDDGDSDVAAGIAVCTDVDGDGDVELPAGFYPAGTIVDADIELNSRDFRFTVDAEDVDTAFFSVDLPAVLVHEVGHVLGLAHSMTNDLSVEDGTSVSMFAFIETRDPDDELAFRSLETEDVAAVSFHYPEGSADMGPAALQPGDVAFDRVFGIIEGEAFHGPTGEPLAGGSVFAVDATTGRRVASALTGTVFQVIDLEEGQRRSLPDAQGILDGRYRLAVPLGRHFVGLEGIDGTPLFATNVNEIAIEGSVNRQVDFLEEYFSRGVEGSHEHDPGRGVPIQVRQRGRAAQGVDFVTEDSTFLRPFDTISIGPGRADIFVFSAATPGFYYAVEFPAEELEVALADQGSLVAGRFHTVSFFARSLVPIYEKALLAPGRVLSDGTARIDLQRPLVREAPFAGQEDDFATLYFPAARGLSAQLREDLAQGELESLFLVLRIPLETPFPGVFGVPPLVGSDRSNAENVRGRSFTSTDGLVFEPTVQDDFRFDLVATEP